VLASIESQLALLTAGLVAMLAIERRAAAEPGVRAGHDGAGQ
jgi:hypothetical protein